ASTAPTALPSRHPMRTLLTLLVLCCASVASAANFIVTGRVVDTAGNARYGIVTIYRSSDKVVAATSYSGHGDDSPAPYAVSVPAGTYDAYIRVFGYVPAEVRDIVVQSDVVRDLTVDLTAIAGTPAYLKSSATSTPAVFAGVASSTTTVSITSTQDLGG